MPSQASQFTRFDKKSKRNSALHSWKRERPELQLLLRAPLQVISRGCTILIGAVVRFRNQGAAFAVSLYSPQELQSVWLCGQATPSVRLWHLFLQEFQFLCWIGDVSKTCFGRLLLDFKSLAGLHKSIQTVRS